MKKAIIFYIILIIFICTPLAAAAEGQAFSIKADGYVVFAEANNLIKAQDNVVIKLGSDEIRADQVVADLEKQEIEAVGNVVLIQDKQVLEGSKLKYDYQSQSGKFYDAASQTEGLYFTGEVINIESEQLVVENSGITACKYDDPHYEIKAEQIEVTAEGKIIATGVELWVKGQKLMPLPKYVTHTEQEERKKYAVPEPKLGYNNDDGLYLEVDYDHYINEDLEGHIFAKVARQSTDVLELDYLYQPQEDFKLDTYLDYNRKFGLGGDIVLEHQLGSKQSRLEFESFFVEDESEQDYKEQSSRANWDLSGPGPDLSLQLRRDADDSDEKMDKKLIVKDEVGDYYWRVQSSQDSAQNYKPELWLGTKDRSVIGNTKLATKLKVGRIYEPETNVDTVRKQFNLELDNQQIEVTDRMDLYWHSKYSLAEYDTKDQYQTYDFNLGSKQSLGGADLNLDYQYFNTAGATPFAFDQLTEPELGARHYLAARLSDEWQLQQDLALEWEVRGSKNYYQLAEDYLNYGMLLEADYQINDYHKLEAAYRYQIKGDQGDGVAPLAEDETVWQNDLRLTYNFVTDQKEFPYWDVELNTLYDFAAKEEEEALERLDLEFVRQFDCFNVSLAFDVPEQGVDFGVDFKY